jgi:hypothetical protein
MRNKPSQGYWMKKSTVVISILAIIKLLIQLLGNRNYGFHRDELLHLSVSEHLSCGYMEFPPMIAALGKISYLLFDYSLMGMRLFPTMAGVTMLIICCMMARQFSKNHFAVVLAGVACLAFLPFYRNHTLFQPVAFDQLFWTIGFYTVLLFLQTENRKYLILTGITLGLGILTKYTILIWAFGVFIGFLFHKRASVFKSPWLYLSGLLTLLIALPNIIWQFQHDLPLLKHLQALRELQLSEIDPWSFAMDQLDYPLTLAISLIGLWVLLRSATYRPLGMSVLVIFATMWYLNSKSYYVFAVYPVLFAAGSACLADYLQHKRPYFKWVTVAVLVLSSVPAIPYATPILPIEDFIAYAQLEDKNGRVELTSDYADMFGWEEQVRLVDSVYQSLSIEERQSCVIWAENYGEAGAVKILGDKYDLPDPISRHGSFWLWGYDDPDARVWISLGNEQEAVDHVFAEKQLVRMIYHKYAIGEENGIPLYICRAPKVKIPQWWADYEDHVFE